MCSSWNSRTTFAQKFVETCHKNNLWYSLDSYSLLGAKRHGGFVPWVKKFQVFMTVESYARLGHLYPENVVDSAKDKALKSYKAFFVPNWKTWPTEQNFVEIRVVVPTTIQRVRKFNRLLFLKRFNLKLAINKLYAPGDYEGFYLLDNNTPPPKLWMVHLSFQREQSRFCSLQAMHVKEYNELLKSQFGGNYQTPVVPRKTYVFPTPLTTERTE